jgi:hypothetical protein
MAQPFIGREDAATDTPDSEHLTFARIERLIGEEKALLEIPAHLRSDDQHGRLHAIGRELDQLWRMLRERADRIGHGSAADSSGA